MDHLGGNRGCRRSSQRCQTTSGRPTLPLPQLHHVPQPRNSACHTYPHPRLARTCLEKRSESVSLLEAPQQASPSSNGHGSSSSNGSSNGSSSIAPLSAHKSHNEIARPTIAVPESLVLPPGQLSHVNREGKGLPADVFRCFGCVKPACQVSPTVVMTWGL